LPGTTDGQARLIHALFAQKAGHEAEARELLDRIERDTRGSPFAETLRGIRERLRHAAAGD
jgi:hypothetical protein